MVKFLPPVPLNCNLIWKQGLYKSNQVKIRSLGWTLNQHINNCHPFYQEETWRERHFTEQRLNEGKMPCEDKGRDQGNASTMQGMPKIVSKSPDPKRESGNILFKNPQKEPPY